MSTEVQNTLGTDLLVNPAPSAWEQLCQRTPTTATLDEQVSRIMQAVKENGDQALYTFTRDLDGVSLEALSTLVEAGAGAPEAALQEAIRLAISNVRTFHRSQAVQPERITTSPGVECWQKAVPVERVGLYIPGGSAPLFSTLIMLAVPAQLAGCREIVVCTPPNAQGELDPCIRFVAQELGLDRIFTIGGAQAIAALAYGTESVPKVDKIFGPGNSYVTRAKQLAEQEGVAIDMPAGPSEVLVIADELAPPDFVAADLLSQAEHGPDSQVILCCTDQSWAQGLMKALEVQLEQLPRKEVATAALANSRFLVFEDTSVCLAFSNAYAPEHLIIATRDAEVLAEQVLQAGSVFLGIWSPESAGDYASGTNHTLPTNGFARAYSGVSLSSFQKQITFQQLSPEGIRGIGPAVEMMAEAEGLEAHKNAVSVRLKALNDV